MNVNASVLHEFALELKKVVEEFEEEMEILSNKDIMDEIKASEDARAKGKVVTLSLQELKDSLEL